MKLKKYTISYAVCNNLYENKVWKNRHLLWRLCGFKFIFTNGWLSFNQLGAQTIFKSHCFKHEDGSVPEIVGFAKILKEKMFGSQFYYELFEYILCCKGY